MTRCQLDFELRKPLGRADVLPKSAEEFARDAALIGGHSYTLTLVDRDDNYATDPTYTLFDDVLLR